MFSTRNKKFATALAAILTLSAPLTVLSTASFAADTPRAAIMHTDMTRHDGKAGALKMSVAERGDHAKDARFHKGDRAHRDHHAQREHFRRGHRDGRDNDHNRG